MERDLLSWPDIELSPYTNKTSHCGGGNTVTFPIFVFLGVSVAFPYLIGFGILGVLFTRKLSELFLWDILSE